MKVLKAISVEKVRVKGLTTIDHQKRLQLNLTCEEYVVLDFVLQCQVGNIKITHNERRAGTGFQRTTYALIVEKLLNINYLTNGHEHPTLQPEIAEIFGYKNGFEIIWKIMKKNNGNKPMGLEAYQKAIGCATVDELITAATNYAELKKDVEKKYFMHVSSFLNTKYKKWEQYLTVEQETPKEESNERTAEFGK